MSSIENPNSKCETGRDRADRLPDLQVHHHHLPAKLVRLVLDESEHRRDPEPRAPGSLLELVDDGVALQGTAG
jgi:hypothetical protein